MSIIFCDTISLDKLHKRKVKVNLFTNTKKLCSLLQKVKQKKNMYAKKEEIGKLSYKKNNFFFSKKKLLFFN